MNTIDGFEDCAIGLVERFGMKAVYCYDKIKMLNKIMDQERMSFEEANEHFENNIIGSWVGNGTPCFFTPLPYCNLLEDE